tara:strand:+ start:11305 stop:12069 length:765 start_codon:yes stop_codon:yes gene_type:complete
MKDEVISQINDYYKLKQKYNNGIQKQKNKIMRNPELSLKDKREHIKLLKKVCINCKKPGGTIFSKEDNMLKAVCGNVDNPCKLNISIFTGDYENIRVAKKIFIKEIENIKTRIIRIKLDLLFNYVDESTSIDLFEKAKQELELYSKPFSTINRQYYDVINNPEVKNKIQELEKELFILEEDIRMLHRKSQEGSLPTYNRDLIEMYINKILPLLQTIRETKYKICQVEDDDTLTTKILVQDVASISDLEYNLAKT